MTQPTTAVVVCAYTLKRWDDLIASLTSASAQQPAPDELWLVVDHNDDLLTRAREELTIPLPGLRVIKNTRRQGLSGARNTALEHIVSDLVVFLDDDAQAEPGWLAALTAPYADPSVVAVGGVAQPRWPAGSAGRPVSLPSARADTDPWATRGELDWVVGCTYAGQPGVLSPVRNLMGCNMSFRRDVFGRVGGFSEDLGRVGTIPLGCEETELCIRATSDLAGSTILFEPGARVRHQVSPDRLTWRYLWRRCYAEGLSKSAVSALVGSDSAIATERVYATQVLPRGLRRELTRGLVGPHRLRAFAGAAAIVSGLAATVFGYLRGTSARGRLRDAAAQATPLTLEPLDSGDQNEVYSARRW